MELNFDCNGILCQANKVILVKLQPEDYLFCTEARNNARHYFLDNQLVSQEKSFEWLEKHSNDRADAIVSIRLKSNLKILGVIGYSVNIEDNSKVEIGRIGYLTGARHLSC